MSQELSLNNENPKIQTPIIKKKDTKSSEIPLMFNKRKTETEDKSNASTGVAFIDVKSYPTIGLNKHEVERVKREMDRKRMIEQLHFYMQKQKRNNRDDSMELDDEDIFKKLHTKIMLAQKYPGIKDPKKKIMVNKANFKYTSLKDVLEKEKDEVKSKALSKWSRFWREAAARQYEK
jgi:hypothetical protein